MLGDWVIITAQFCFIYIYSWRKTILNLHTLDSELAVLAEEGGLRVTEGSSVKTLEQYSAKNV